MRKIKSIATIAVFGFLILGLGMATFLKKDQEYSVYERRKLAQRPEYQASEPLADYFSEWEGYLADQFFLRDELRFIKSIFSARVLQSSDVNGYYIKDGSEAQLLYPMNRSYIESNIRTLETVRQNLFAGCDAYFAVIPDKSSYMNAPLGLDYQWIEETARGDFQASGIDLSDCLTADDFYRTDIHWKQQNLRSVYEVLRQSLKGDLPDWDMLEVQPQSCGDFYGVLYGQAAYPMKPDELVYLTGRWLDGCKLTAIDTGTVSEIYQPEKAAGDDPYDLFLGGEYALTVLENPNVTNGKKLILFRDSFGRSLAPLLASGYEKIILIDLRWIKPAYLERFSELLTADESTELLFLLSGQVLNSVLY